MLKNCANRYAADIASMILSSDFSMSMKFAEENEDTKAFLMIQALKEISLNPLRGKITSDFIVQSEGSSSVCFWIDFDRWVNFIGLIELPAGHPRVAQLIEAINQNLNSKMFKAAKLSRRMDKKLGILLAPAIDRATKAYAASYRSASPEFARAAYNFIYEARREQLLNRQHKVSQVSHPGFNGEYSKAVAGFLYRHLPFAGITH
jgi:hypothetical protein